LLSAVVTAQNSTTQYDVIVRHGTVVDGTGAPRYRADVAIAGGSIARVGDLANARAEVDIDATGLFVAPGFINVHSHATPDGLMTAANMLTQGVTTEILNADGSGPIDLCLANYKNAQRCFQFAKHSRAVCRDILHFPA
jgi:N-acyl-D-amino-acid deacylase